MSAFDYRVAQLPAVWPGTSTPAADRKRSPFKTIWSRSLSLLGREIAALDGYNTEIAIDVRARDIRVDGGLRADARPASSAIVVSFDTPTGRLAFPCDRFAYWADNVHAVALSLEALRKVDRYGVQPGKQYTGFKALPASTAPTLTTDAAAQFIAAAAGEVYSASEIQMSAGYAREAIRTARKRAHPDTPGGSGDLFHHVELARRVLNTHHGVLL